MNMLITSAGRRGYIVEYFRNALGEDGTVHVGNSTPVASALHHADKAVITPMIYDKEYIPFLLDYCKKEKINLLISLFDIDLMVLAKNKERFAQIGTKVIVSDERVIDICNDKLKTHEFLKENGFDSPKTLCLQTDAVSQIKEGGLSYPVIVKPRWGMGSIAVFEADNDAELEVIPDKCRNKIANSYLKYESSIDIDHAVLYQEKLNGQEYGMDVINDLDGNYMTYIVKKKLEMRAGETDSAMVIIDERFAVIAERISKALGHIGNLDIDLFESNGKLYILEMNARFGGGYPFSHAAGVDLPTAIVKWLKNEDIGNLLEVKEYNKMLCKELTVVNA